MKTSTFRRKKLPIAILHFTAGFILLDIGIKSLTSPLIPRALGFLFVVFGLLEVLFSLFISKIIKRNHKLNGWLRLIVATLFLLYTLFQMKEGHYWSALFMLVVAIAFAFIYFLEKGWMNPSLIVLREEGVTLPGGLTTRLYPWTDFNHVIVKNDLLTLDFKSNKIMQLEIKEVQPMTLRKEIETFCGTKMVGTVENRENK